MRENKPIPGWLLLFAAVALVWIAAVVWLRPEW